MDLRCPICGSSRINYYSGAIAKYRSTDARYVCEDCGYVGGLILDISADESKDKNPVEEDLEKPETKKKINESDDKKEGRFLTYFRSLLFFLVVTSLFIAIIWFIIIILSLFGFTINLLTFHTID
ncbi:MAG: hypothetical protein CVT88_02640 [Candidatus Altiarchaeales archaeon HGW-Altiarchaeales-1]|nr:MAG: hypothetical protein CVT88_02640 [Candidatus Altiarchaeales archaeon HGW-Altiarchaeales-1]